MSSRSYRFLVVLSLFLAQVGWGELVERKADLSTLFEDVFRGSREVHVPRKLFVSSVGTQKILSVPLNDRDPFKSWAVQGMQFFPRLTNDDQSSLYFDPYYGGGPLRLRKDSNASVPTAALRYDKKNRELKIERVLDMGMYLQDATFGFYSNLETGTDGVLRIDVEKNWGYIARRSKVRAYDILNPKDLDLGADRIILLRSQATESDFPYMQSDQNTELLIYSRSEKSILESFTLPFTGSYLPIMSMGIALQSVVDQNFVFLVLNSGRLSTPKLTVPKSPRQWHLLIYDEKNDTLYSVWHGMDESDGLPDLSFSYYLGLEGLYFEVLKQGKIEIYLVDIDLEKATPLREYETVDLLWNNKGLKEKWTEKIHEARSNDASFEQRWE